MLTPLWPELGVGACFRSWSGGHRAGSRADRVPVAP